MSMRFRNRVMTSILKDVNGLRIIGPEDPSQRGEFAQFIDIDAHDIAILLDELQVSWCAVECTVFIHGLMQKELTEALCVPVHICTIPKMK